jgi:hypothetical protein
MNTRKMCEKLGAKVGAFFLNVQLKRTRRRRFRAFQNETRYLQKYILSKKGFCKLIFGIKKGSGLLKKFRLG